MPYGYHNKILRLNLSNGHVAIEEPGENFFRRYLGGRALIAYYLLKELEPGVDPLSPENKLIFATGVVTGVPIGGSGRNSIGARSPLTGAYGDTEAGGYWGAVLKRAGYDAIIVEGQAEKPVYLWIHDGEVEFRPAEHLWGQSTAGVEAAIKDELGDRRVRVAQCGPAGEKLVRFACVVNDLRHFGGRTGMGAVMGSKRLRAIAVRGGKLPEIAEPDRLAAIRRWLSANDEKLLAGLRDIGTLAGIPYFNVVGNLPTGNFQTNCFGQAEEISGETMRDTILVNRGTCFACPTRCKRVVEVKTGPWVVDRLYGGPEYESVAALGSCCGVGDLRAISKANELCAAYGLDTISTGVAIAFAMECYERGILNTEETGGEALNFGSATAMVGMVERIARREGLGDHLAEGVNRAAERIGRGAERYAMQVKGQEIPMHEPRFKQGMGLGYAVSSTGADHAHNIHDDFYLEGRPRIKAAKALGLLEPLALTDLSPAKVRLLIYETTWRYAQNSLGICQFLPYDYQQLADIVCGITGWKTTVWEIMKAGERAMHLTRAFNLRHGFTAQDDRLPDRFFEPFSDGPLAGVAIEKKAFEEAIQAYYRMMGWDEQTGVPTAGKLQELDIAWVQDVLGKV